MDIMIRPAEKIDSTFLSRIILNASRSHLKKGLYEILLNLSEDETKKMLKKLITFRLKTHNHFSWFFIAEIDGQPAAALCAYDHGTAADWKLMLSVHNAAWKMKLSREQIHNAKRNFMILQSCIPPNTKRAWIVENVATLPEFQKRNCNNLLLKRILEKGAARGHAIAQVSVLIENEKAKAAYMKAGFKKVDEYRNKDFEKLFGSPGMEKYLLEL